MAALWLVLALAPARAQVIAPVSSLPASSESLAPAISLQEQEVEAHTSPYRWATPVSAAAGGGEAPTSGFTIDTGDRNAVVAAFHLYYMSSEDYPANHSWNGNVNACNQGSVSAEFLDDCLRRINYYRAQAGREADISFNSAKSAKAQKAALVMAYQNNLSHYPSTDFPGNPCNSADSDEAAGSGNIALGSYGPGAIDRYMIDSGSSNGVAGHRRWFLYSRAQEMGQGSIPFNYTTTPISLPQHNAADCVYVIGNFKAAPPNLATPWPNAGYAPYPIVPHSGETHPRWSFSYPGASFSSATVTMTQGGSPVSLVQETVVNGFGDNTIVWRPSGIPAGAPAADTTYTVTVSGVTGAPQSSFVYDVTVMNPFDLGDEVAITGPANPYTGGNNAYTFNPISQADSYELRASESVSGTWLEGAETSPAPQVIDNTSGSYTLTTTALSKTGSRSFHLTIPDWDEDGQNFIIDRIVVPSATSQLQFVNRFRFVSLATALSADISDDGGTSWTTLWTRNGDANSSSGSSSTWETTWKTAGVAIPPGYTGKSVSFRFRFNHNSSAFLGTSNNHGCFIDDIQLSSSTELLNPSTTPLAGSATGFNFNPAVSGKQFYLQIRPEVGTHFFEYGPPAIVTSIDPPLPPVITSPALAQGAQGEVFSHTVTATNSPQGFSATGLPAGLSIHPTSGVMSGNIAPGTYTGITVFATNGGGSGQQSLTIEILTGFEQWVQDNYPGLGAPGDDDDADGVTNIIESAILGMDPTVYDSTEVPVCQVSGDQLIMTVNKSGVAGLDYTVEGSSTLASGSWSTSGFTILIDNATTLQVSHPVSSASPAFFCRLRVDQNDDPTP